MRIFMATAALAAAFLGAAACTTTAGTPSSSPSPTVSLVDIKTSCGNYAALQVKHMEPALTSMAKALEGIGGAIGDPAKGEALLKDLLTELKSMAAEVRKDLEGEVARTGDPVFKAQLVTYAGEMAKLDDQLSKIKTIEELAVSGGLSTTEGQDADKKIKDLCRQAGVPVEAAMAKIITK